MAWPLVQVLRGHEGSVLAVLGLPNGEILTASQDKTIRRWSGSQCTGVLQGHTDTVRALALLPGGFGVASASHDCTVRTWTLDGSPIGTMEGHTSLVYTVACAEGILASGSEDNTMRIWTMDGVCTQVVPHPACVWALTFLPSGDLATACGDAVARVWTRCADRCAPAELLAAYQ
eukprot:gene16175-19195_t